MSRQIRYRAYYKPENRMIYDIQDEFEERIELGMDCFADYLNNDDFVVEQDTGLKDKNGVSIWEGDIVSEHNGDIMGKISQYESGEWQIKWIGMHGGASRLYGHRKLCEVIGNIHDNKGLLEDESKHE